MRLVKGNRLEITDDNILIEALKQSGYVEQKIEPQPKQDVEVAGEYVVRPAKKKKAKTKGG